MKKLGIVFTLFVAASGNLFAQSGAQSRPQTARQALVEMFFSKTPGTFNKHLPAATLAAIENSGAQTSLQQYSLMAGAIQASGGNFQTFETGSVLLAIDDPKTQQKFEVTVENDALRGDDDDIELSFQAYKNGSLQRTPYMPRITFSMKMERSVWKLNEISITVHLPLADPDLLKNITEGMKARAVAATANNVQVQNSATTFGNDPAVLTAIKTILTAETTYAGIYRATGYTCTLSDLDGFGGGEANEHQAMLINSGLASGKRYGYVFTLSGCGGSPSSSFHLTAVPGANNLGRRAYCTDQTGMIRYSADGTAAACLAGGSPVQ